MQGIYLIKNILTETIYVGSSINIEKRFAAHKRALKRGNHDNVHLQLSYNKHGLSVFDFSVFTLVEKKEDLSLIEKQTIISFFKEKTPLYNLALVIDRAFIYTEETKNKMRLAKLGEKHPMFGKKHLKETKEKISISLQGNKNHSGKYHTEEEKEHLSKINRGEKNPRFGVTLSEETKKKISVAQKERLARKKFNG